MSTHTRHDLPDFKTASLTIRYLLALCLIAMLSIGSHALVRVMLHEQATDGPIINLSGRQRMLSQKLTKEVLLLVQSRTHDEREAYRRLLSSTLSDWSRKHIGLQYGDAQLQLPGRNSQAIQALFAEMQPYYRAIRDAAEEVLSMEDPALKQLSMASPLVRAIVRASPEYLHWMDQAVFQYDQEAQARVASLQQYQSYMLAMVLVLLLMEALLIFRPTVGRIHTAFTKFREAHEQLIREIAEREQAEKALKEAHDELEARVRRRTSDLVDANRKLKDQIDERARAEGALRRSNEIRGRQTKLLAALLDFSTQVSITNSLEKILQSTVETAAALTHSHRISVMLPDRENKFLTIAESVGISPEVVANVRVPVGVAVAGEVFKTREAVVINQGDHRVKDPYDSGIFASVPMISTPLTAPGKVVAVLNITDRDEQQPFTDFDLEYVDLLSNIAASAIHDTLMRKARDDARHSIVLALAKLAEYRDSDTGKHLERVTKFSVLLADELRKSSAEGCMIDGPFRYGLEHAVPLHDIGKVGIPDRILLKPGRLTKEEMAIMQQHAAIGAEAIRSVIERNPGVAFLEMAEAIAHCHHERFDGSGYPRGLKGLDIPLCARIAALADVYDALTTNRPYKNAFSHEKAKRIIMDSSGTHFEPSVVDAFLKHDAEFATLAKTLADDKQQEIHGSTIDPH